MIKKKDLSAHDHPVGDEPESSFAAKKLLLALDELDGTLFENLLAVRTGLSATEVREVMGS